MSSTPESFTTPDPQSVDESEPVPTPDTVIDPPERYLTVEELSERAQSELDRALDSYSIPSAVTRAFQRTACWTRYAHYLTTTPIEESVSQPSPKALQEVGDDVSEVQPLSLLSGRGPKRCRLLPSNDSNLPTSPESVSSDPDPRLPKRTRLERMQQSPSPELDETELVESQVESTDVIMQSMERDPPEALARGGTSQPETNLAHGGPPWFEIDRTTEHRSPRPKNLPRVFPFYMCTAIAKGPDRAIIAAFFKPHRDLYQLVLDINGTEVQYFAQELFGVHVRGIHNARYITFDHGPSMDINVTTTLKGSPDVAWEKLFGETVTTAIRQSLKRRDELSKGVALSHCVSMEIWRDIDSTCQVTLAVDEECLVEMVRQLWEN